MIKQYRTGVKIMPNILIVEDDININNLLCEVLRKAGYTCEQAFSGTEAKLLLDIKEKAYTLVLLDLMLPGASGEEVLKEIRKQGRLPVIVLTAKDSIDDKIGVLTDGADDYITKPFYTKELLSRISANLRRSKFNAGNIYKKGDIVVDFDRYKISRQGDELNISTNEFDIVKMLIENKGRVVRRDAIYEKIWDIHGNFVEYNTLTVAMSRIKAKLGTYGEKHQQYIETIRNVGYRWID